MIDLTPLDVRKKKGDFRRAMRGYEPALVDDFLDLVADRLEALVRESRDQADELIRLRERVTEFREREKALTEALVTAQEMREDMRRQAERDADLLQREAEAEVKRRLREAEAEAEAIRAGAAEEVEREEEALRRLRARRTQLLRSFRSFLERELGELRVMEGSIEAEEELSLRGVGPEEEPPAAAPVAEAAGERPEERPAPESTEAEPEEEDETEGNFKWLSSLLKEES